MRPANYATSTATSTSAASTATGAAPTSPSTGSRIASSGGATDSRPRASGPRVAGNTVLVVDDEKTLRETVAYELEQEGFRVVTAADGRAALEGFRAESPDLVLLDLMLPELSGTEVCRILRSESNVPIIMLTAKS